MNPHAEHLEKQLLAARKEIEELRFLASKGGDSVIELANELAELRKRVCVPEGYVVVPAEATRDMIDAANSARGWVETDSTNRASYRAMLAAAPAPVERVEQEAVAPPVAWQHRKPIISDIHGNAKEWSDWIDGQGLAIWPHRPLYTTPQPAPTAAQDGWVSVAERMPPAGTKVLAFYHNSMGVSRRICAEYIGKHQRDAFDFDQDCEADYDEATDQYYWTEGWYERVDNWDELTHLAVTEGEITHWRVMPEAPCLAARQSGGAES